jgi:hypothetical protein
VPKATGHTARLRVAAADIERAVDALEEPGLDRRERHDFPERQDRRRAVLRDDLQLRGRGRSQNSDVARACGRDDLLLKRRRHGHDLVPLDIDRPGVVGAQLQESPRLSCFTSPVK